ncbi:MAG: response regulator [Caldimicrobium sp.]|nr:response regulator [Caldimicrobium sp.]MCX7873973.1 response regulator [Caldimicrobium sp.]MDW8094188.1 response regulator [Caldimicrobium sp.]
MDKENTLLIIDDEVDFLEVISKRLKRRGFQVFTAVNCKEGLEILKNNLIDLIVLDVMLPDLHGLECLAEIKKLNEVPVILLTGHASLKTGIESLKLGAKDYCLKPIDFEELVEKIQATLRESQGSEA